MSRSFNKKTVQKQKEEVVVQKPQPIPVVNQGQPNTHAQIPQPQPGQQHHTNQNPVQPPQQLDPNNEIVQNMSHKEETIQELMLMGFDRHEVEKALAAAFYYKERAIEYLISVVSLGNS